MNLWVGVLSLIFCTFSGYRLSIKYVNRRKFFADFYAFNEKMINEVSFSQKSILTVAEEERGLNRDFGRSFYDKINDDENINLKDLNDEEKNLFNEYVNNLGKSDRESQLTFLSAEKKIIDELRISTVNDEQKYGKLYVKVGFLFGLVIFVALI